MRSITRIIDILGALRGSSTTPQTITVVLLIIASYATFANQFLPVDAPLHVSTYAIIYSALLAAIAGALYVPQVGIINPGEFSPISSIEIVVWVAMGGRGTLYGAILGAVLVNYAKTRLTAAMPDAWLFALGGLFVGVTLLLPHGLVGLWSPCQRKLRAAWQLVTPKIGLSDSSAPNCPLHQSQANTSEI
jgi:hypothetical protein